MLTRYVVLLVIGFGLTFCEDTIFDLARAGNLEAVKKKIENGSADPNATDEEGRTVLQIAVSSGSLDVVKYLVKKFNITDLNTRKFGYLQHTLLHQAARSGSIELVKYLVEEGADPSVIARFGVTVLHYAAQFGKLDMVKYLVVKGADPKAAGVLSGQYNIIHLMWSNTWWKKVRIPKRQ